MAPRIHFLEEYHFIADAQLLTLDIICGRIRVRTREAEIVVHGLEFRFHEGLRFPDDRVDLMGLPGAVISIAKATPALAKLYREQAKPMAKAPRSDACPGHPEVL